MNIQKLFTVGLLTLALLAGIVACTTPAAVTPANNNGTEETGGVSASQPLLGSWNAVTIGGNPVNESVFPTLTFDATGAVSGHGSCNGYGGTYTTEGGSLTIEGVVSTMMACEDQTLMTQESTYFEAIQRTATYTIEGETLSLLDVNGDALATFTRA